MSGANVNPVSIQDAAPGRLRTWGPDILGILTAQDCLPQQDVNGLLYFKLFQACFPVLLNPLPPKSRCLLKKHHCYFLTTLDIIFSTREHYSGLLRHYWKATKTT